MNNQYLSQLTGELIINVKKYNKIIALKRK